MTKICIYCKKEFETKKETKIFCSVKCCGKAMKKRGALRKRSLWEGTEIACVVCGKNSKLRSPGCLTCSKECSKQHSLDLVKIFTNKSVKKLCKGCGKISEISRYNAYCSVCLKLKRKETSSNILAKTWKKICLDCGFAFETKSGARKWCDSCKNNREKKKPIITKICAVCGEQFQTKRPLKVEICHSPKCVDKIKRSKPSYKVKMKRQRERRMKNPYHKLHKRVSTAVCMALKGTKARKRYEDLVGYTTKELKEHLESFFQTGMTWENHGKVWEIDHVLPKAFFSYTTADEEEFKVCWSKWNLKPRYKTTALALKFGSQEIGNQEKKDFILALLVDETEKIHV